MCPELNTPLLEVIIFLPELGTMPLPASQVGTWESHHLGQNLGDTQQLLALELWLLREKLE